MPATDPDRQMHEGPWLDRLFPIQLAGGRTASVTQFGVLPSNVGILEGGLSARWNARQRVKILELARGRCGDPLGIVEPVITPLSERPLGEGRERLPWMACYARLTSAPMDSYMVSSEVTLVWWLDAFELPLQAEIERAAAGITWEAVARDIDLP